MPVFTNYIQIKELFCSSNIKIKPGETCCVEKDINIQRKIFSFLKKRAFFLILNMRRLFPNSTSQFTRSFSYLHGNTPLVPRKDKMVIDWSPDADFMEIRITIYWNVSRICQSCNKQILSSTWKLEGDNGMQVYLLWRITLVCKLSRSKCEDSGLLQVHKKDVMSNWLTTSIKPQWKCTRYLLGK